MFQARVFTFSVFLPSTTIPPIGLYSNDCEINIVMTGFETRNVLDKNDAGINVQSLTQGDIPALMSRSFQGCIQNAYSVRMHRIPRHTL